MDKQSVKVAKQFFKRLKKKFDIKKLILFGSRARGDNLKSSDYDFLVVSDDFKEQPFIFRASELYDFWDENVDFEPLCYTVKEFEKKKKQIGIVQQAVKEGIEI